MAVRGSPLPAGEYGHRARELYKLTSASAVANEHAETIADEVVDAFHAAGLFHMLAVAECGGGEASFGEAFEVVEAISCADGSAGWSLMAGMTTAGIASVFFGEAAVADIFSDRRAVCAGQLAPLGVAESTEAGFRVEGNFGFASGSTHAQWFLGGFREMRDGEMVRLPSGAPNLIGAVFPRRRVELMGNWDVIGLCSTHSQDYRVPPQEVDRAYTFELLTAEPLRGPKRYRIGVNGLTCIAHAAFASGVARRALDEVAALAQTKRRAGRKTLIEDPLFQVNYARAEGEWAAARTFAVTAIDELAAVAASGEEISRRVRARARLATTQACFRAEEITGFAYRASGSIGLRNGAPVQRCFRDMAAAGQHVFTEPNTLRDAAQVYLDVAPPGLSL